eukprot:GHRQ01030334.1.p2 GENE.GHRQ01030334.1~~GHRQ01030334.1.p2  ORF type:complete len:135 (-),score=39.48 GHRQ01030334.1:24-428(-)
MGGGDPFAGLFGGMGGMGGMGGGPFGGMGGGHPFGGMSGMGGGPMGGMHQGPIKDKPIARQLNCTLEELYSGSTRKMKITRTIFDGSGRPTRSEEEVLELRVKPGWKKGTKLTFQQKGGGCGYNGGCAVRNPAA